MRHGLVFFNDYEVFGLLKGTNMNTVNVQHYNILEGASGPQTDKFSVVVFQFSFESLQK